MNRSVTLAGAIIALGLSSAAQAGSFTWQPIPADLNDLDHYMAITWRISGFNIPTGETITGAKLTFTNIYNWDGGTTADKLFINLLNTSMVVTGQGAGLNTVSTSGQAGGTTSHVTFANDSFPTISDYFDTSSTTTLVLGTTTRMNLIDAQPPKDAPGDPIGVTYELNFATVPNALSTLTSYIGAGNDFAFGFDPDCHYFNSGVSFQITTTGASAVPEPTSVALLGTIAAFAVYSLRKRKISQV